MKTTNLHILESYLGLLNNLSPDSKLELISRLSQTLKSQKKSKEKSLIELFGAFQSDKSAETIIEEIQQSRTFTRQIEGL
ncbi:hypothetical protein [Rufibacter sp. LB8]|uniref:hypothetical protein n=1 Tax=Rufibacter sp. LB8 TaxID=2777781 RepID=UPI00178C6A3B|nr:hypothetical protein [Rufibacter sp. LB8]